MRPTNRRRPRPRHRLGHQADRSSASSSRRPGGGTGRRRRGRACGGRGHVAGYECATRITTVRHRAVGSRGADISSTSSGTSGGRPTLESMPMSPRRIAIGSDHAGYELKQHLVDVLLGQGSRVTTSAPTRTEPVDYPPFCAASAARCAMATPMSASCSAAAVRASSSRRTRCAASAPRCATTSTPPAWPVPTTTPTCWHGRRVVGVGLAEEIVATFLATTVRGRPPRRPRRPDHRTSRSRRPAAAEPDATSRLAPAGEDRMPWPI